MRVLQRGGDGGLVIEVALHELDGTAEGLEREGARRGGVPGDGADGELGGEVRVGQDVADEGRTLVAGGAEDGEDVFGHAWLEGDENGEGFQGEGFPGVVWVGGVGGWERGESFEWGFEKREFRGGDSIIYFFEKEKERTMIWIFGLSPSPAESYISLSHQW